MQEQLTRRIGGLPAAKRLLDTGDVTLTSGAQMPDDWWALVTVASLVRRDPETAVLWEFRACMAYSLAYDERRAADGMYADLLDMLGRNAAASYASLPPPRSHLTLTLTQCNSTLSGVSRVSTLVESGFWLLSSTATLS